MSAHLRNGISRRAYAKRRGVTEGAIRRRITDGTLTAAMVDGKIDADKADELLAASTVAGSSATPSDLSSARRRKAAAATALIQDAVDELERSLIPSEEVTRAVRFMSLHFASRLFALAPAAAPEVAGLPPAAAADALQRVLYATLDEIAGTDVEGEEDHPAAPSRPRRRRALGRMSAVEIAALRADLQARRMTLQRAMNRGEMVLVETSMDDFMQRVAVARARLLAMPSKLATTFEAIDEAKAAKVIAEEIDAAVAELACKAISAEELRRQG